MKQLIGALVFLSVVFGGLSGADLVRAQGPVDVDDASGSDGTCTVTGPADDHTVFCTDRRRGREVVVVNPPAQPTAVVKDETPAPTPNETEEPAAPETSDRAVATANDQDADNAADDQEPGLGLDPTNPDTDGDGVADGDEPNIYGTDPLTADTDGDGVGDGEELFGVHTDPLVANNATAQGDEIAAAQS
jgi:hypothetical protein